MIVSETLKVEESAMRWVALMQCTWTDANEEDLAAWLAANPRGQGALLHAMAVWESLEAARTPSIAPEVDQHVVSNSRFNRRWVLGGGGAALAASIVSGVLIFRGRTSFATDVGEIRRVPLEDGSMAAINTSSEIEVSLGTKSRQVRITRGEAWFQVAKDKARPFVVEAGRVRVQAVGTAFSVRRRDGGVDVLVTEGTVEAWAAGAEGHRVRLSAGARAFVADDAGIREDPEIASAIDRTLAWRAGQIDLAADTLADATAEFNRYNRIKLVILDPRIADERIDGVFRTDDPEGFATTMRTTLDVPIDRSKPEEIGIGRRPG